MALPADFSKIFGSTATGGLTPISDVSYAKGWEFVGANPPTKNDFSYLQNMSDIKSQWLYNYLSSSSNAASRTIGSGLNQVPDMSLFASSGANNGYQKLPGGLIIQWGRSTIPSSGIFVNYPIPFPTLTYVVLLGSVGATATNITANNYLNNGFSFNASATTVVDQAWAAIGR